MTMVLIKFQLQLWYPNCTACSKRLSQLHRIDGPFHKLPSQANERRVGWDYYSCFYTVCRTTSLMLLTVIFLCLNAAYHVPINPNFVSLVLMQVFPFLYHFPLCFTHVHQVLLCFCSSLWCQPAFTTHDASMLSNSCMSSVERYFLVHLLTNISKFFLQYINWMILKKEELFVVLNSANILPTGHLWGVVVY